jgi:hypothetical protein
MRKYEFNDYYNFRCGDAYLKSITVLDNNRLFIEGDAHDIYPSLDNFGIESKLTLWGDGHIVTVDGENAGKALAVFIHYGFQNPEKIDADKLYQAVS